MAFLILYAICFTILLFAAADSNTLLITEELWATLSKNLDTFTLLFSSARIKSMPLSLARFHD